MFRTGKLPWQRCWRVRQEHRLVIAEVWKNELLALEAAGDGGFEIRVDVDEEVSDWE
jgi:hypothetical protein